MLTTPKITRTGVAKSSFIPRCKGRYEARKRVEMAIVNGYTALGDDEVLEAIFNPEAPTAG